MKYLVATRDPGKTGLTRQCECTTMHCMDEQLTFRIPPELARLLNRSARDRGVPRAIVVREALAGYLAETPADDPPAPSRSWEQVERFVGAVKLDPAKLEADELARRVRDHNWRV
ncbi:MAG: CopG family transcriptional regulator [Gemmatimonadales bacterium]|nr:CopG family transcriptional regulator [Gemmatimonadales bacterium]